MTKTAKNEDKGLDKSSRKYEKPIFEASKGMSFTAEIWEKFNGGPGCMQCSSCHGCAGI